MLFSVVGAKWLYSRINVVPHRKIYVVVADKQFDSLSFYPLHTQGNLPQLPLPVPPVCTLRYDVVVSVGPLRVVRVIDVNKESKIH